jgi:hypothetical protein
MKAASSNSLSCRVTVSIRMPGHSTSKLFAPNRDETLNWSTPLIMSGSTPVELSAADSYYGYPDWLLLTGQLSGCKSRAASSLQTGPDDGTG